MKYFGSARNILKNELIILSGFDYDNEKELTRLVRKRGGKVAKKVTGEASLLVYNDPGVLKAGIKGAATGALVAAPVSGGILGVSASLLSKLKKDYRLAKKLDIETIPLDDFLDIIGVDKKDYRDN